MSKSSYPRKIIVRLISRTKREEMIAAAKTARRLHPSQAGIFVPGFDRNIFINEHLTLQKKILYKKVREVADANNFKYHWVKHGVIHVRRNDNSKILTISKEDDLNLIK